MNKFKIVIKSVLSIIRKKSKDYGFTLMELMVIMAIFSILAAVGMFTANQYLPKYRKQAAGRTVLSDLVKARIHAIKSRVNQTVTINNDKYTIHDSGTPSNIFLTRDFELDFDWKDIRIQSTTNPTFNTDGTVNNISNIEVNCGGSDPVEITMTITGNLRIVE
jgi:type IV fimbrial biogenesis protein FimT